MGKSGAKKKKNAGADGATKTTAAVNQTVQTAGPIAPPDAGAAGAGGAAGTAGGAAEAAALVRRAQEVKEEGNRLFQSRDYAGALRQYELALELTPRGHPDRAVFHSNRAACLMQMRPVDHEAVAAECSLALQSQPRFPRALLRRARALESLRRFDLALLDVRALLALDPDNRDALDLLRRLRHAPAPAPAPAPSRPSPAALGASAVSIAGLGPSSLPARPFSSKKSPKSPPPENPAINISHLPHPHPHPLPNPSPSSHLLLAKPSPPPTEPAVDSSLPNGRQVKSSTKKPPSGGPTSSSSSSSSLPPSASVALKRRRPLKLVYDHDIRLAEMPVNCSFGALREAVAKRFPSSKSVLIKYKDAEGDLVTITSSTELRLAESCLAASTEGKNGDGAGKDEKLGMMRLHVVEVSPEQEPPLPEEEEEEDEEEGEGEGHQEREQEEEDGGLLIKGDESLSHSSAGESLSEAAENGVAKAGADEKVAEEEKSAPSKKECGHPECKEVEIDDWLFEFAQLFRNQVGIDPDAHLDLHELGMELCSEALEETVTSEEAQSLFEMAASKFQEVAALAFFNWGNVHMCAARKRIPLDDSSPKEAMAAQLRAAYDWVREKYSLAGEKYEEALRIKPDFYEGLLALGQQNFETAKLHWSFALADKVDLSSWDYSETIQLFDSSEEKMMAATEMWEKVEEQRIAELKDPEMSKKDEILKKRKKQGAAAADGQGELTAEEAAEQAVAMRSQIHLFWGNMLFERSQVEFKLGVGDWKKNLDAAIERFKLAGASEADISMVLKNHSSNAAVVESDEKKVASLDSEKITDDEDKHLV